MPKQDLNERISILDRLRKKEGRVPYERKPSKIQRVVGGKASKPDELANNTTKRMLTRLASLNAEQLKSKSTSMKTTTENVSSTNERMENTITSLKNDVASSSNEEVAKNTEVVESPEKLQVSVKPENQLNWKSIYNDGASTSTAIDQNPCDDQELQFAVKPEKEVAQHGTHFDENAILNEPSKNNMHAQNTADTAATDESSVSSKVPPPTISLRPSTTPKVYSATRDGEYCSFGCANLIYDFNAGVSYSKEKIKEVITKLVKNKRTISASSWLEQAEILHGKDPYLERLCAAMAFNVLMFNYKTSGSASKRNSSKKYNVLDLEEIFKIDTTVELPSGMKLKLLECLTEDFIQEIAGKETDAIARKITVKVMNTISELDVCTPAYSVPLSRNPFELVDIGTSIQKTIAEMISTGLKWEKSEASEDIARVQSLCRGTMENFLARHRTEFNQKEGKGSAKQLADDLKKEIAENKEKEDMIHDGGTNENPNE